MSGEDLDGAVERLRMVAEKTSMSASIGGVYLWLKRLGDRETPKDLDSFAEPYRLELVGDIAGAARSWADSGARYDQALALSFGTPEQQEEALGIFASINAAPALARLSELTGKKMKAKRGRPAQDGPFGLTKRQLDVLRLLGDGLSNAQIGETLFISPKTVDHHVSAILARLEATSRGEAAAKARKLSLI